MSQANLANHRIQSTAQSKQLTTRVRLLNRSMRRLVVESLERRCAMDAAIGDWISPVGLISTGPIWLGDDVPALSDLQAVAPEVKPASAAQSSPDSIDLPLSPILPPGPEYAIPSDVQEIAPFGPQPESKVTEPLFQEPGDVPAEVDDDQKSGLEDDGHFDSETEGTEFAEIAEGKTKPDSDHGSLKPNPVQFTSLETPLSTISLREVKDNNLLSDTLEATPDEGSTFGRVYGERRFETSAAGYLIRSEISLTNTRYFETQSNDSLSLQPLLSSQENNRSLRRFRPPTSTDHATISIGALAGRSQRAKSTADEASPAELAEQNGAQLHRDDIWDVASEAIIDMALTAIVGEVENNGGVASKHAWADVRNAKFSVAANANGSQRGDARDESLSAIDTLSGTPANDFARSLSRFAVLGFILSKGITLKSLRLPPTPMDEFNFSKTRREPLA